MVGLVGYAPTTPSMSTRYSTIELQSHICLKISLYFKLIENSIDADATQIDITIDNGGKNLISVSDNGIGIKKNLIPMAIERHATSKLPNNDLNKIAYLGFRGEALPSIAAVSELNIQTKFIDSNQAWSLDVAAGNFNEAYPSSRQTGTIISVKKLSKSRIG